MDFEVIKWSPVRKKNSISILAKIRKCFSESTSLACGTKKVDTNSSHRQIFFLKTVWINLTKVHSLLYRSINLFREINSVLVVGVRRSNPQFHSAVSQSFFASPSVSQQPKERRKSAKKGVKETKRGGRCMHPPPPPFQDPFFLRDREVLRFLCTVLNSHPPPSFFSPFISVYFGVCVFFPFSQKYFWKENRRTHFVIKISSRGILVLLLRR